jgi:CBS domain-containing protein
VPLAPAVVVAADLQVGDAARRMRDAGTSAVIIAGHPPGILTDSDLRGRVLAEGRGPHVTVAEVATRPVRVLDADATLFDALEFMLEQRVHHAALARDGEIVGILTDTDLLRLHVKSPLYLLRQVERLRIPDELPHYTRELTAMVRSLRGDGLEATRIGPVVSRLQDALVVRLIRHAERDLGPPPAAFAWVAFGSEGRLEQLLVTDQVNGLVWDDAPGSPSEDASGDRHRVGGKVSYFQDVASRVVEALVAAGVPRCPGGFMATTWCDSRSGWCARIRRWVDTPDPQGLLEALNVLDLRPVHGRLDLEPIAREIMVASRDARFLAHVARMTIGLQPPLGPFRQIRQEEGGVDLKKGGIVPIVGLARLYALEAGSTVRSTLARLDAAADAGTLSREGATTLGESFRFLLDLQLREQLRGLSAGEAPGTRVALDHLSSLERRHLKDVFSAIRALQDATALRHGTHRLA